MSNTPNAVLVPVHHDSDKEEVEINKTNIFRGFFQETVRNVADILKYSELAGINHIIDRRNHILERIIWLVVILLSCAGIVYTCAHQWNRYEANPTVISLERDYRHWNGTLPSATLCYTIKIDPAKADDYIKRTWNITSDNDDYRYFMGFIKSMANLTLENFDTLTEYELDGRLANIDLRELVEFVYPSEELTIRSFSPDVKYNTQQLITERGVCVSINTPLSKFLMKRNETLRQEDIDESLTCDFQQLNQCFVRVEIYSPATIQLYSPVDVPVFDAALTNLPSEYDGMKIYNVVETLSSDSVKSLSIRQRRCLFRSEMFEGNPKYSGKLCKLRCRALNALQLCHCKPFYYPFIDGPECTISGYVCLARASWPLGESRDCKCPDSCTHYTFLEHNAVYRFWSMVEPPFVQKITFRWEILPAKVRNRRDVLFSFEDFIGTNDSGRLKE